MGIDLRLNRGWKLVREGHSAWQLRHSPYPGREMLICQSDERGDPPLDGLRDLLNREFGTPSLLERARMRISGLLLACSRRVHPDFWPEGRHGMHRSEPGGSWVPPPKCHTGVATYRTARADEHP